MVKINQVLQFITYLVVLVSYLSVFRYLEVYHSITFGSLLLFSVYLTFNRFVRIPRWVLNVVSIAILLISSLAVSAEYLVEPVLGALMVLIAIKLIEEKAFRDYAQIFAMCIFVLLGSSLLSFSIAFLGYFSLIALFATTALILLAYFAQDAQITIERSALSKVLVQSLAMCAIALPGSLIFFVILPRTNYPILSFLNRPGYAKAGFSDSIQLGDISAIQEDNNVILRAEMPEIAEKDLYWRGIVLDQFDGSAWRSSDQAPAGGRVSLPGSAVTQIIYLEPYGNKFLFALDKPQSVSHHQVRFAKDLTYSLPDEIHDRIRYSAASVVTAFIGETIVDSRRYLQMPADFSPRIKRLAQEISAGKTGSEVIESFLQFIARGGYHYSLENLPRSDQPLEDFLFDHKAGNCEFFASAFAVMLRMSGIPARLVGGYKGGYYNRPARYYMVLQNNAHVWVEAYLADQRGWIRIDPTMYSRSAPSLAGEKPLLARLRLLLDTFNYYWYRLIINYDFSKQLALIRKIKATIEKPDIKIKRAKKQLRAYLPYFLLIPTVVFLCFLLLGALRKGPDRRLIEKFQRKIGRCGYSRQRFEGLEEFVARIDREELRARAEKFVNEFEAIYYKDEKFTRERVKTLHRYLSGI